MIVPTAIFGSMIEDEAAARADRALGLGRLSAGAARARRRSAGRTDTRASRRAGGACRGASDACQYNFVDMSILKVARMGHPVLRAKARPLEKAEIRSAVDAEADRRHDRHDGRVSRRRPGRAAGARGAAAVRRGARRRRRGRRGRAEPLAIINPEITVVGADRGRGLGRLPEHSRRPRARAAGAGDQGARARSARAGASSCARTIFRRASSSTRPITSTACCSSIG